MDYQFTQQQEDLKKEFEDFFKEAMKEAPKGYHGGIDGPYLSEENWAFHRKLALKLAEKKWLVRHWPKEWGGQNAPTIERIMFNEVAGYYQAPGVEIFGVGMIGPAIMKVGTEKQKKYHLPRIANGEIMWCQGWSEPDAGSDLGGLQTRAKKEGDHYIVNGQKVWTSNAHRADWMFLGVRTDSSEKGTKGISNLLLDMKTQGITVKPIAMMDGRVSFNEVFFDDVAVPVENLLGGENQGWQAIRMLMNAERITMVNEVGLARRVLDELIAYCKETYRGGDLLINNPAYRQQLAERATEIAACRGLFYRLGWLLDKGDDPVITPLSSAVKVSNTETLQRVAYTGYEILGLYGQVKEGSRWAAIDGVCEEMYQSCPGLNMAGGTSEIQRNLIAWVGLQLPR